MCVCHLHAMRIETLLREVKSVMRYCAVTEKRSGLQQMSSENTQLHLFTCNDAKASK